MLSSELSKSNYYFPTIQPSRLIQSWINSYISEFDFLEYFYHRHGVFQGHHIICLCSKINVVAFVATISFGSEYYKKKSFRSASLKSIKPTMVRKCANQSEESDLQTSILISFQAVLGVQLVVTLLTISIMQKVTQRFSFGKWLLCQTGYILEFI